MRKVLRNHQEVCHYWANRVQESGRASNMKFIGNLLYSYNTVIAKHLTDKVTLFEYDNLSISTSKHQSYARWACKSEVRIFLPCRRGWGRDELEPFARAEMQDRIETLTTKAARARTNSEFYMAQATSLATQWNLYVETVYPDPAKRPVGYDQLLPEPTLTPEVIEQVKQRARAAAEAKRKREAEQALKDKELLQKTSEQLVMWQNDPTITSWNRYAANRFPPKLRVRGDVVETSWGADAPLTHAQRLWRYIQRKEAANIGVGHYTVTSQTDKTLTIGCHRIEMDEVMALVNRHPDLFPKIEGEF